MLRSTRLGRKGVDDIGYKWKLESKGKPLPCVPRLGVSIYQEASIATLSSRCSEINILVKLWDKTAITKNHSAPRPCCFLSGSSVGTSGKSSCSEDGTLEGSCPVIASSSASMSLSSSSVRDPESISFSC